MTNLLYSENKETSIAFDLSKVKERFIKDNPEYKICDIDQVVAQYTKYITLAGLVKENLVVPSKIVDDFWHTHLLFTRSYNNFCMLNAKKFVNHEPHDTATPVDEIHMMKVNLVNKSLEIFGKDYFGLDLSNPHCSGTHCESDINPGYDL
jgi:hypothetical protein